LSDNPAPAPAPRQNRVLPTGEIVAHPARGTLFGKRGSLHDAGGRIVRTHQGRRWISCVLSFKGRRRPLMQPGRYTELFFLDEAAALAAGHRPCAECRRADHDRFRDAWALAFGARPGADGMDAALHAARIGPMTGAAPRPTAPPGELPDGAMVLIDRTPHLIAAGAVWPWAPGGYGQPQHAPQGPVALLTPAPILSVIAAGYRPALHETVTSSGQERGN
jgi:hypothetical protein